MGQITTVGVIYHISPSRGVLYQIAIEKPRALLRDSARDARKYPKQTSAQEKPLVSWAPHFATHELQWRARRQKQAYPHNCSETNEAQVAAHMSAERINSGVNCPKLFLTLLVHLPKAFIYQQNVHWLMWKNHIFFPREIQRWKWIKIKKKYNLFHTSPS